MKCEFCGKPESEHVDEWGRHEPCIEQIESTLILHEVEREGGLTKRPADGAVCPRDGLCVGVYMDSNGICYHCGLPRR